MSIINITAERLYREAYEYFYCLENSELALLCAQKALEVAPYHQKTLSLMGEIFLLENEVQKAVECFKKVEKQGQKTCCSGTLANIAVCHEMLEDWQGVLYYCEMALGNIKKEDEELLPSLYQLKISALISLKKYTEAKKMFEKYGEHLFEDDIRRLKAGLNSLTGRKIVNLKLPNEKDSCIIR